MTRLCENPLEHNWVIYLCRAKAQEQKPTGGSLLVSFVEKPQLEGTIEPIIIINEYFLGGTKPS